jgi:hypothetical protein
MNPFKKKQPKQTQTTPKPVIVKVVEPAKIEPCNPPCSLCLRVGCCRTCKRADSVTLDSSDWNNPDWRIKANAKVDQISLWCSHDLQPSAFSVDSNRPQSAHRRKFALNEPCYIDDKPCVNWQCKFLKNLVTGEIIEL